jgi:hypothetical protein
MKKDRPIKIRKDWGNVNPVERVVPHKREEDEKFDNYKGIDISEDELEEWEE